MCRVIRNRIFLDAVPAGGDRGERTQNGSRLPTGARSLRLWVVSQIDRHRRRGSLPISHVALGEEDTYAEIHYSVGRSHH